MSEYFSKQYDGGAFFLFGQQHLYTMLVILLICVLIILFEQPLRKNRAPWIRFVLAFMVVGSEFSWHIWKLYIHDWNIQVMLPLWLCSLVAWLSPLMLVAKNYRVYEFSYFMGIIGASQAILTPDLMIYGFPHFRFIQYFTVHGSIIISIVYMTFVEGFRPTWRSFPRVIITMNLYWLAVSLINPLIDSNYLYTAGKLPTPSLLDVLGPWPWYLLSMEIIGIILMLVLYLPFWMADRKQRPEKQFR